MSQTSTISLAQYGIEAQWLRSQPAQRRLLMIYAHPDDETFGNAGSILRYSSEGAGVYYACATRGECGTVAPTFLQGYESIAALRTAELSCAAQALGLAAVYHLNYRDSGMPGSADNQHPQALIQAPEEQVIGRLVALIRLLRPQVIVTFGPYGGYGHPDHIAMHRAATVAFARAGDLNCHPEQVADGLEPWSPGRLYYSTSGVRLLRLTVRVMRLMRRDPRRIGQNQDIDLVRAAEEATPITTSIACGRYLDQMAQAWACHASQVGPMARLRLLPRPIRRVLVGHDHFTRVVPDWKASEGRERDLFGAAR